MTGSYGLQVTWTGLLCVLFMMSVGVGFCKIGEQDTVLREGTSCCFYHWEGDFNTPKVNGIEKENFLKKNYVGTTWAYTDL